MYVYRSAILLLAKSFSTQLNRKAREWSILIMEQLLSRKHWNIGSSSFIMLFPEYREQHLWSSNFLRSHIAALLGAHTLSGSTE